MEQTPFEMMWSIVGAGLIVPIVQYIKRMLPADIPISTTLLSAALSLGAVYGLAHFAAPEMTFNELLPYALGLQFTNQVVHSVAKTPKKLKGTG